ncbi:MAG: hypothetical protein LRY46_01030 [Candidatus Pacebacteria bacterium]|nr:hypothetical protein [Candidatus Paceibacterota bacterium]MCD8508097.1 hypothetical protein [Candidatus Paceibacterota bacterium]MCD8563732.1 hypothetical protein [Candidatus Paceibacterota bacterium]
MIGYIGLGLLLVAYMTLLTHKSWLFAFMNSVASILLTAHAFLLGDIPFIIVNALVASMLIVKIFQDKLWRHIVCI